MKYAQYDPNNNIIGFFDKDIHETIPNNTIEITDEEWQNLLNHPGKYIVDINEKKLVLAPFQEPSPEEIKQQAIKALNREIIPQLEANDKAFLIAFRKNDTDLMSELTFKRQQLEITYEQRMEVIESG
jgi:hypothetical protein